MRQLITCGGAVLMLFVTVAWASTMTDVPSRRGVCVTPGDVSWHLANSREGISLTCDAGIQAENAEAEAAR